MIRKSEDGVDLRSPYVSVHAREQVRHLRFFVDQLGTRLHLDVQFNFGNRRIEIAPSNETASLALVLPSLIKDEERIAGALETITFLNNGASCIRGFPQSVTDPAEGDLLLLLEVVVQVDDVRLQVLFQTMFSVCAADAGFAPAGMEALHGLEVLAIDVGFAKLQLIGGAHGYAQVRGVDRGGQAILAVVGHRDGFVGGLESGDGQYRAKGLLLHDGALLPAVCENRWRKEVPCLTLAGAAAAEDLRAILVSLAHNGADQFLLPLADQRAHFGGRVHGIADHGLLHRGNDPGGELLGNRLVDINPLSAIADLAGIDDARGADGTDGEIEIGIGHDDRRGLAA